MSAQRPIELRSDNCAGVAPQILAALAEANAGSESAYGADAISAELREAVCALFEQPDAHIFPVVSGTAANSIALSAMCPPWGMVLCHESAHIYVNEAGATSMFGAGAVMRGLAGDDAKLHPQQVQHILDTTQWGDPHQSQPAVVSITCPTDFGTIYTPQEIRALASVADTRKLRMHLDGARIANALVTLNCSPSALTTEAGVPVFSLGATKNGTLSTDAIVCFDTEVSDQLAYRLKRSGHVASKMRFQSIQLLAYLRDGLWLQLARQANDTMSSLANGLRALGVEFVVEPQANILFAEVGQAAIDGLTAAGLVFYDLGGGMLRFVTSWQTTDAEIADALERAKPVLSRN